MFESLEDKIKNALPEDVDPQAARKALKVVHDSFPARPRTGAEDILARLPRDRAFACTQTARELGCTPQLVKRAAELGGATAVARGVFQFLSDSPALSGPAE